VSTADACEREASWLSAANDGLPSLLAVNGGPWKVIAAYFQGAQTRTQAPAIYVTRGKAEQIRVANQRIRPRYPMRLELYWPVLTINPGASSIAAQEQQNLDDAIELLRQRVTGPLGDKSHGGRFLSAAEVKGAPGWDVTFEPASVTIRASKEIRAVATYVIDDFELNA
jgi:hypothetical protein